jgi:hypothetical protein
MWAPHLRCLILNLTYPVLLVLALAAPAAAPAGAEVRGAWTQVGILTCVVNSNIGFIIAGHQSMKCEYQQAESDPPQVYQGSSPSQLYEGAVNTIGLDAGVTDGGVLGWTVFASTEGLPPGRLLTAGVPVGALAGEYVGVSGDIGLVVPADAAILIDGSARSFALLLRDGAVAFNIVLGVSMLKLRAG